MNTMIISAFPGCGKTYLYENQSNLEFDYSGNKMSFTFSDSSHYDKQPDWEKNYVDDIVKKCGAYDFIFISQYPEVLAELSNRGIPFIVVAPDNSDYIPERERKLIKQQWFGRFLLRANSHIKDFPAWLELLKANYDNWTSVEHLTRYQPTSFFVLKENEYLSDIIEDLYWKKETYADVYCYAGENKS